MWIKNAKLVLPDQVVNLGGIQIEDGSISKIEIQEKTLYEGLNAEGLYVLPGFIDLHGDMIERDLEPRPGAHFPLEMTIIELDKRLASNGVTTAFSAVRFRETHRSKRRTDKIAKKIISGINSLRHSLLVDFLIHARYELSVTSIINSVCEVIEKKQVHLVSLMDHTPGQGQFRDLERYSIITGKEKTLEISMLSRDEILKNIMIITNLAKKKGIYLASHDDDTSFKVNFVSNLGATISEFPVTLEAARAAKERGMHVIMGAPNAFRDGSTIPGNLSARQGIMSNIVDILASDYHPASLLYGAWEIWKSELLPLHRAINLISLNPAKAVGLTDRGSLQVGKSADIVLIEPGVIPRIRAVFRKGTLIYGNKFLLSNS